MDLWEKGRMYCHICDKDLASCVCADLGEKLESIKTCAFLHIGSEYLARIEAQAKKNCEEKELDKDHFYWIGKP